ncbi:MAG: sigma-70 family RNA polymerase sigma factor [Candidatus Omnitrophica bacterium]|nr:sigma-70 family RNA polymerase sigma factor [Candidatus Omnitrophota bacterium]
MSNQMDDSELIERFLAGDGSCFDRLIERYQHMVFNVCMKMLGNYDDALDLSQDIFLKLYTSLGQFRGRAKFSTYLYRICMNYCKNRIARYSRRRRHEPFSKDAPVSTADGGQRERQFAADGPSPRDAAAARQREALLRDAVHSLPADFREVIVLKEFQGLKYEEIAAVLEIEPGTVKSRLSRARQALKEKVKKYGL